MGTAFHPRQGPAVITQIKISTPPLVRAYLFSLRYCFFCPKHVVGLVESQPLSFSDQLILERLIDGLLVLLYTFSVKIVCLEIVIVIVIVLGVQWRLCNSLQMLTYFSL